MQIILEDEDEGEYGRRTGVVGVVIYTGGISKCVEREHDGGIRVRRDRI